MHFVRHIIIFLLVLSFFALVGIILPKVEFLKPQNFIIALSDDSTGIDDEDSPLQDFNQQLESALPVISTKIRNQRTRWELGKGISMPVYLLRAQKSIVAQKGKVIKMQELNYHTPSARLSYTNNKNDTFVVDLVIGSTYLENSSQLGVAFTVDSNLSIPVLNSLNSLPCPYSLLVQPYDTSKVLRHDLDKLANKEIIAWLPMEPYNYPYVKAGINAILLHHSPKEIADKINDVQKFLPQSVGFATHSGEKAVEHKPLLQALLTEVSKKRMWMIDLSANKFSKVTETCQQLNVKCRAAEITAQSQIDLAMDKAMTIANRTGSATLFLPVSEQNIAAIHDLYTKAQERGTEIVKLSDIMSQID
ncbi:MAG: divergent polysaccharide deacetylase family protein [Fibrobacter sp.]|nr:divergent polysaccharide deacetylase family protein [Fibrobacter sp.]